MRNKFRIIIKSILFTLVLLCSVFRINAQNSIEKPTFSFTQICANSTFNTFSVTFKFSPVTAFSTTNQFILELSDASGSFTDPLVVFSSAAGSVISSPKTISFSVPTIIVGENFKLRVRSTSPALTSPESNSFAAYYKIQDSPFSINNFISTASYCTGGNYVLTIDNPGTGSNDSPLKYPSLSYNWYKETSPTTSIFVSSGSSLTVNQPGTYYVQTNYGSCTSDSYSNRVAITEAGISSSANITSSLGNPYCLGDGPTTLSATTGNNYQWSKDGNSIAGATNQTYVTNVIGTYSVAVNNGSCVSNASINLQNTEFISSINVPDTNTILPNETLNVITTSSVSNLDYKWYLNGAVIPGATFYNYDVKTIGSYKVVITQTSGCISTKEFAFVVNSKDVNPVYPDVTNIPNLISPNGDGVNDTWVIPLEYVSGTNTEVVLLNSQGDIVLQTNNYENNWPDSLLDFKNVNPVYYYIITTVDNKIKKGSITVVK